jgi:transposase
MLYYLGVDIGKFSHSLCLLSKEDKTIFQIENTRSGFNALQEKLSALVGEHLSDLVIGMEATGHYFLNLYDFLLHLGVQSDQIAMLNPLQVKSYRNTNLRGSKTDNVDAERIAVILKFGEYQRCNVNVDKLVNLREFTRLRNDLVISSSSIKRKMIAVLDRIFPEFAKIFSNSFGKTALSLITDYPTPEELAELSLDELTTIIKKLSKRGLSGKKIQQLHDAARDSIGISFGKEAFTIELHVLITRLNVLKEQIDFIEKKIEAYVQEFNSPIFSIPGVGVNTGATIIAEIGDIQHFRSATKLIAFAGLDPKSRESGTYQGRTPISKRGSKYLRNALWYSAMVATRVEPTFKKKYKERRAKGKSHKYAVTAAANKLTKIVYHVLKNDCVFDPHSL